MKAVVVKAFGGVEGLEPAELPDPKAGPGEVVLRVRACALNHLDLWVRQGLPGAKIALPHVLGCDVAGEIESVGPGASGREPGGRYAVQPGRWCGACAACRDGREPDCPDYGIIGAYGGRQGGYAERLAVPADQLLAIPEGMSFAEAASLPLTALTAWSMLSGAARLAAGETALIIGAGSGVAAAGIQIAKALGARVIATSTDAAKLERAKALGADLVVHHPPEELARSVRKLTAGAMADVVFEHVGGELLGEAVRCLRPSGRLVTCGATADPVAKLDLRHVFMKRLRILGVKMGTPREMREVWELVKDGRLKPVVDRVYPLAEARAAHERLASRGQFGKVVLQP